MIFVFDLDDTLYEEESYVRSGFRAVAKYLRREFGLSERETLASMLRLLPKGRGTIFDDLLARYGKLNKKNVRACLRIYRAHRPSIKLFPRTRECLRRFPRRSLYLVTDGNAHVQLRKIKALGLEKIFKRCFRTRCYGLHCEKPSPYVFHKICEIENVPPSEVVYIADNPAKDFRGIRPLGFRTLRVMTGQHRKIRVPAEQDAEYSCPDLRKLSPQFLEDLF